MDSSNRLASLPASYFGFVMATGIVAVASHLEGQDRPAEALLAIATAAFVLLAALHARRFLEHRHAVHAELRDPLKAAGFFTWAAASAVLGSLFIVLWPLRDLAWALWAATLGLWALFAATLFKAVAREPGSVPLERIVDGASLLAVVATQSIAVLSALLAHGATPAHASRLLALAVVAWLAGIALYVVLIALILRRLLFRPITPHELTPPYWITMGALAISTLAGSLLASNAGATPWLRPQLPWIQGVTLSCWAIASAWIPALLAMGTWRYGIRRFPLRYNPAYWSAVFPLGMYSAATKEMSQAFAWDSFDRIATAFLAIAVCAWLITFVGMLRAEWREFHGADRCSGEGA